MTILLAIYTLLGGWRGVVMAGLLAGSVATAAWYVSEYDSRGREIVALKRDVRDLEGRLVVAASNNKLIQTALDTLNKELLRRDVDIEESCKLLKELAEDKTPGADDQVQGTIGKALDGVKP
jgi:hypothetical protein